MTPPNNYIELNINKWIDPKNILNNDDIHQNVKDIIRRAIDTKKDYFDRHSYKRERFIPLLIYLFRKTEHRKYFNILYDYFIKIGLKGEDLNFISIDNHIDTITTLHNNYDPIQKEADIQKSLI